MGDFFDSMAGFLDSFNPEHELSYDLNRWVIAELDEDPNILQPGEIARAIVYILLPREPEGFKAFISIKTQEDKNLFLAVREIARKKTFDMFYKY